MFQKLRALLFLAISSALMVSRSLRAETPTPVPPPTFAPILLWNADTGSADTHLKCEQSTPIAFTHVTSGPAFVTGNTFELFVGKWTIDATVTVDPQRERFLEYNTGLSLVLLQNGTEIAEGPLSRSLAAGMGATIHFAVKVTSATDQYEIEARFVDCRKGADVIASPTQTYLQAVRLESN